MKTPKRPTEDDRVVIAAMSNDGKRQCDIAKLIGFSDSTISKELPNSTVNRTRLTA